MLDYKSQKELADYLNYLDSNTTAYNEYFKWKKYVKFDREYIKNPICDMCIYLHLEDFYGVKKSIIDNIGTYWSIESNCKSFNFK